MPVRGDSFPRRQTLRLLGGAIGLCAAAPAFAGEAVTHLPEAEFDHPESDMVEAMQDTERRMTAPVYIDGKGPFDFIVDTGTNRSVISARLAEQLGLEAGPSVRLHGIAGTEVRPSARAASFRIGQRETKRLVLPIMPSRALEQDGMLGVDGLKDQRVVMDFGENVLTLESSRARPRDEHVTPIPARRRFGQLTVVDTDLDGLRVAVVIDTGSEVTTANSALRAAMGRKAGLGLLQEVTLVGAAGDSFVGQAGGLPRFRLGSLIVNNLRVVYADVHPFALWDLADRPAMLLGIDVLRFLDRVTLDFGRSELRVVLPPTPYVDPAGDPVRRRL
jgi:predicted aspartyl protease